MAEVQPIEGALLKGIVTVVYGLLIVAGGVMGYATAGSAASLVAGGLLGLAATAGGVMLLAGIRGGVVLAAGATLVVLLFFGARFYTALAAGEPATRAAMIFGMSLVELVVLFYSRGPAPQ